jgi:hypothetical protein
MRARCHDALDARLLVPKATSTQAASTQATSTKVQILTPEGGTARQAQCGGSEMRRGRGAERTAAQVA